MEKIRLLLLIPHLGGGGAEHVAAQLACHLDPRFFDIHVGLVTKDSPGARALPPEVRVHRLGLERVRQAPVRLLQLVWSVRPSIILSGMAHLNQMLLLLKPFFPPRTRLLIRQNTTASLSARTWFRCALYRFLYGRADRIICQSSAMAADLAGKFRIRREKLVVLANPIDRNRIRNVTPPETPLWPPLATPRLLSAGRLAREKGLDLLLQALVPVQARHPAVHLTILGRGPEEVALRELAQSLGIASSVTFVGFVPEPAAYYACTTLFVLSSRFEGMPNALLEAAAGRLPLAATPCCDGVVELLRGQPGVWQASEVSSEALAEVILSALASVHRPSESPVRFEHPFLAPFDLPIAIRAFEKLLLEEARGVGA